MRRAKILNNEIIWLDSYFSSTSKILTHDTSHRNCPSNKDKACFLTSLCVFSCHKTFHFLFYFFLKRSNILHNTEGKEVKLLWKG